MAGRSGYRRMRLRRADGRVYLDRWGFSADRVGGVYLHRMSAPDPGLDLHDHPWTFVTIPLWGGYTEQRAETREAPTLALLADRWDTCTRGVVGQVRVGRPRLMRLDECHRITALRRHSCWTLVFRGPRRRGWGFYGAGGYIDEVTYDLTERRDLWNENVETSPSLRRRHRAGRSRRTRPQGQQHGPELHLRPAPPEHALRAAARPGYGRTKEHRMVTNPAGDVTPVDRVPAFVVAFGGGQGNFGPGRIDVDVAAGRCVLTVGRAWAVIDREAVLDLKHALNVAAQLLPAAVDDAALDHARRMVEGLGLEFPC